MRIETDQKTICTACGQPCKPLEIAFDYAGTHCTHGKRGTHRTGLWESDCCGADVEVDYE